MSLIKWQPFGEFDDAFAPADAEPVRPVCTHRRGERRQLSWAPSADISETETEYLIRAELPAVKKEDVKVMLDQGLITIQGERKEDKETKDEKFHRVESFRGAFFAQLFGAGQHRRQGHPRRFEGWRVDGPFAEDKGDDAEDRRSEGAVVAPEGKGVGISPTPAAEAR